MTEMTTLASAVDPESWSLANMLSRRIEKWPASRPRLLLCVVTRPIIHHGGVDFEDIVAVSRRHGTLLQLRPLSEEASATYLKRFLQVADLYPLPNLLIKYINDMAAGNPKHIEELAAQLKSCGYLSLEKGRVILHREDLYALPIPPKMSGYIMNMIDRFQIRHQLIVKIASTCDCFTEAILNEIIPYREDAHLLPNVINELVESGIFLPVYPPNIPENVMSWDPNTTVCYTFASKLLQRQANDLLLHSDREKLEQHRNKVGRGEGQMDGERGRWVGTVEGGACVFRVSCFVFLGSSFVFLVSRLCL